MSIPSPLRNAEWLLDRYSTNWRHNCLSVSVWINLSTMIQLLTNTPSNVVAFRAVGEITEDDYKAVIVPKVREFVAQHNELNFLLLLDTPVKNFTFGAWFQDALLGLRNLTKWNRGALVSDSEAVTKFTNAFSLLSPGEFKGFDKAQLQDAIAWTSDSSLN